MTSTEIQEKHIFKFNMSLYYQATIIYLIIFLLYAVVKGQFIDDSFSLITKDPVIYFFVFVLIIAIAGLLYNLFLNRHIEILNDKIILNKGGFKREITFNEIRQIKIFSERRYSRVSRFGRIKILLKNKMLPITIRPYDYENSEKLIESFRNIQNNLGKKLNV